MTRISRRRPFAGATAQEAFDQDFGPESAVTDVEWKARPDLVDGKIHLYQGALSAIYEPSCAARLRERAATESLIP